MGAREQALADALKTAADRCQLFLDTFGEVSDCVTQADINDWHETLAAPSALAQEPIAWRWVKSEEIYDREYSGGYAYEEDFDSIPEYVKKSSVKIKPLYAALAQGGVNVSETDEFQDITEGMTPQEAFDYLNWAPQPKSPSKLEKWLNAKLADLHAALRRALRQEPPR